MDPAEHQFTPELLDLADDEQDARRRGNPDGYDGTAAGIVLDGEIDFGKTPISHGASMTAAGRMGYPCSDP